MLASNLFCPQGSLNIIAQPSQSQFPILPFCHAQHTIWFAIYLMLKKSKPSLMPKWVLKPPQGFHECFNNYKTKIFLFIWRWFIHCCLTQTKKQQAFAIFLKIKNNELWRENPTVVINHIFNLGLPGTGRHNIWIKWSRKKPTY